MTCVVVETVLVIGHNFIMMEVDLAVNLVMGQQGEGVLILFPVQHGYSRFEGKSPGGKNASQFTVPYAAGSPPRRGSSKLRAAGGYGSDMVNRGDDGENKNNGEIELSITFCFLFFFFLFSLSLSRARRKIYDRSSWTATVNQKVECHVLCSFHFILSKTLHNTVHPSTVFMHSNQSITTDSTLIYQSFRSSKIAREKMILSIVSNRGSFSMGSSRTTIEDPPRSKTCTKGWVGMSTTMMTFIFVWCSILEKKSSGLSPKK